MGMLNSITKQVTVSSGLADLEDFAQPAKRGEHACACDVAGQSSCSPADLLRPRRNLDEAGKDVLLANSGKLEHILARLKPTGKPALAISAAPTSGGTRTKVKRVETPEDYFASLANRGLTVYMFGELVKEPLDHPVIRPSVNAVLRAAGGTAIPEGGIGDQSPPRVHPAG